MNRSIKTGIKVVAISILLSNLLFSQEQNQNKKANAEIGWRFGNFEDINSTKKFKTEKEVLEKILKIQEEELKTQKEILKIIQKQFDPKPEIITVNGKKCVANSSAECYKWMPVAEAKQYPVIAQFFGNPTTENAYKYMKWYSKHINNANKASVALYMAKYQYGDKASNFSIDKAGMLDAAGAGKDARELTEKKMFKQYSKDFYVNIYLGRGLDVDIFGLSAIRSIHEDNPSFKYNVIFYNNDVKDKLEKIASKYDEVKYVLDHKEKGYVSKALFKKHGIYSTPSIEIVIKKDNSSQIIGTGKVSPSGFISKTLKLLWLKGIIKDNAYTTDYKTWDNSTYLEETMYDRFKSRDIDLSKYNYKNTDMKPKEQINR